MRKHLKGEKFANLKKNVRNMLKMRKNLSEYKKQQRITEVKQYTL